MSTGHSVRLTGPLAFGFLPAGRVTPEFCERPVNGISNFQTWLASVRSPESFPHVLCLGVRRPLSADSALL